MIVNYAPSKIERLAGRHMTDQTAGEIMDQYEWDGLWPEVEMDGIYTGSVLDSDADVILVDWLSGELSNRNGHACEACIRRYNASDTLRGI